MSDILTIAMKRHEQLKAEMGRIERFLKTATELLELETPTLSRGAPATAQEPKGGEAAPEQKGDATPAAAPAATGQSDRVSLFRRDGDDFDLRKAVAG